VTTGEDNPRQPKQKQNVVLMFGDLCASENVSNIESLMSFSINYYGGALLIMMAQNTRSESLFYYFRIEDQVPEHHLLRLLDRYIDFAFVRETLKESYSHTGRPSIDPEVLLRILLIGYLYGITSERRLVEDVGMHLAYRWFTGGNPHHTCFRRSPCGPC